MDAGSQIGFHEDSPLSLFGKALELQKMMGFASVSAEWATALGIKRNGIQKHLYEEQALALIFFVLF